MMLRRLVTVVLLSLAACYEPASEFDDSLILYVFGPPSEILRRGGSPDLFDFATTHWRFYDDYLDLQAAACDDDTDGGKPDWPYLWRHGTEGLGFDSTNGRYYGRRAGLDVSPLGIVVMQTDDRLWTFAADGGAPLHADLRSRSGGGPDMAAFATDTLVWTDGDGAPSLYDFGQPREPFETWKVVYSWRQAQGQAGSFDYWFQPSPAVQRDGTLIWTSGAGVTRALKPTGEVKWQAPANEGPLLVTEDDVVIRSNSGDFVAFDDDGGVRWHAPTPSDATRLVGSALVDEGRYPSTVIPMLYRTSVGALLVTRRTSDGAQIAMLDTRDAGNIGGPEVIGADRNGSLFINAADTETGYSLAARTPALQELWRAPAQKLEFAPIVSETGDRLVTIDSKCRVKLIDRYTGNTLASHRMVGRPGRFLPRYINGVLYVVAEFRAHETVKPSEMQGRVRPDGGIIDVSDYGCFSAPYINSRLCPPVEADNTRRVYALYAFQVE